MKNNLTADHIGYTVEKEEYMWYKAEYEDDRFEMIFADSDEEAFQQAYDNKDEFGTLFNVFALDENDNEIRTVF